ncbi:ABC transporter permease [Citricoccus nitrophenolicus]|uniref:ABC transporter permease n=1 Tax=Citricoccus nitrophenolicus TaxID=863575 RepID=A0ABV0IGJ9_9MICC
MTTAIELGVIYAIMALGVYVTFRILDFPDLTVDGSFTTGAAVAAISITHGVDPYLTFLMAFVAGFLAGVITGLLHTKGRINGLLAGILTQIALYSINLRIMAGPNVPLLGEDTALTPLDDAGLTSGLGTIAIFSAVAVLLGLALVWFLHTDIGLAMQATGDNERMIRSYGVNTDNQKILGLALSNGLVGLSGAVVAQYQGFADVGMGIGLIIAGLASVILGQAIFGTRTILVAVMAVIVGSVLYRVAIQLALMAGLDPNDMKLISAVLVVIALVVPQMPFFRRRKALTNRADPSGAVAAGAQAPPSPAVAEAATGTASATTPGGDR